MYSFNHYHFYSECSRSSKMPGEVSALPFSLVCAMKKSSGLLAFVSVFPTHTLLPIATSLSFAKPRLLSDQIARTIHCPPAGPRLEMPPPLLFHLFSILRMWCAVAFWIFSNLNCFNCLYLIMIFLPLFRSIFFVFWSFATFIFFVFNFSRNYFAAD